MQQQACDRMIKSEPAVSRILPESWICLLQGAAPLFDLRPKEDREQQGKVIEGGDAKKPAKPKKQGKTNPTRICQRT